MINKIKLYGKLIRSLILNEVVTNEEYGLEYNDISDTYKFWSEQMGKHVDKIIKLQYLDGKDDAQIIDLACGTGYITRKILASGFKGSVEAVDISQNMLEKCEDIKTEKVKFICGDGIEFLKNRIGKVNAIYCGWALPYLNYRHFLKSAYNVLADEGIIAVISNSQGTLEGIEDIYLEVMEENIDKVIKPMDARIRLPRGVDGLKKWFQKYNFYPLELGEGEEMIKRDTPEELYDWLCKTGALAGTNKIFKNMDEMHSSVIEKIKVQKYKEGKYVINHRFVYGIFKKGN